MQFIETFEVDQYNIGIGRSFFKRDYSAVWDNWTVSWSRLGKLENVAIANALQLEAARRRAGPIPFNTSPLASLKSLSLSVAALEHIYC